MSPCPLPSRLKSNRESGSQHVSSQGRGVQCDESIRRPMGWGNPPRETSRKDGGVGEEGIPGRGTRHKACEKRGEKHRGFVGGGPARLGVGLFAGCRSAGG